MNIASLAALLNGDVPNALLAATPGGIERQEAAGQANLCKTADRLPASINSPHGMHYTQVSTELGIVFGKIVDEIFIEATLPEGWKIEPTDHSMWSHLLDAQGRKRASIFYKAAFYDRSAHINYECRYRLETYADKEVDGVKMRVCQIVDSADNSVLWVSNTAGLNDYSKQDQNYDAAKRWLAEQFPDHNNPFAYW